MSRDSNCGRRAGTVVADAANPEAVIEFRVMYSNISNRYNAGTHRAPYTGFTSS